MLHTQVIGRLGADATTNTVGDRVVINFSVAADIGKNKQGNKLTRWVKCAIWRDAGKDAIASYLKKGTQVYVDGLPDAKSWEGQNGLQVNIELTVYKVKLLSSDQQQSAPSTNQAELDALKSKLDALEIKASDEMPF